MIDLVINGEPQQLPRALTVAQLLSQRDLGGKRVAVERNGEIVPKSQHAMVELCAGDRLEIVVAVGGG
ncbi:MAG: sulfur carrier protein ThiS [Rhodocyclaceae bacterium]|nr:sulfur carrier protein ThiS [Rhodocyclaceae bacterium]